MASEIDYNTLFKSLSQVCLTLLAALNSPELLWKCINLVSVLLEGCRDGETLDSLEEFKNVNFVKLLGTDSELIEEALVDMCSSLV